MRARHIANQSLAAAYENETRECDEVAVTTSCDIVFVQSLFRGFEYIGMYFFLKFTGHFCHL